MRSLLLLIILCFCTGALLAQKESINQIDANGRKQGHWIYYGKDRPEMGYPDDGKIEEGTYIDNRKEGIWTKYYNDGKTPKLRGEYQNNRPTGKYWKFDPDGAVLEEGVFTKTKPSSNLRGVVIERSGCGRTLGQSRQAYNQQGIPKIANDSVIEESIQPIYKIDTTTLESNKIYLWEIHDFDGEDKKYKYLIKLQNTSFKVNGFNRIYNEFDEFFLEGDFRDSQLWDGKVYEYDED
ncbi:MAG: toxin-antitoxin system YwqK family antitoxin [Fluviicola sp.]